MGEQFITTGAVLKRFGVSRMTLHRWLTREDIDFPQPIAIGNRRYFAPSEIDAFVERRRRKAAKTDLQA